MKRVLVSSNFSPEDLANLAEAAARIQQGKLVAFPTETVYGLGANALDPRAVARIFQAKGRPSDNPLIVHIADQKQLAPLVESIPDTAQQLMTAFWPGPLTLIFLKSQLVPDEVSAGGPTVAVRQPNNPIALELINQSGFPIAAPSANSSGKPSPTQADHVQADLGDQDIFLLDGGPTQLGVESTVLDISGTTPILLRSGGLSVEAIEEIIGPVEKGDHHQSSTETIRSPGMKYRHYAPKAKVVVVKPEEVSSVLSQYAQVKTACITLQPASAFLTSAQQTIYPLSSVEDVAQQLFSIFRECDRQGIEVILVEEVPRHGLGRAVMNRTERASQS
jgi:L-threonylcarbamoyladenylate synthase